MTENTLEQKVARLERLIALKDAENERLKSELYLSQQRASESEEIFKQFLLNCPIYVFFKDPDIRILHLSSNYIDMFGVPVEAVVGKTMDEIFPPDLAKSMIADDQRILNEGTILEVEEVFNGRTYYTQKFPIHLKGKPRYLAGYTMDITDRKQFELTIRQQNEELIQLNEDKDRFMSILAHDLKSPFTSILGFLRLLAENIRTYDIDTIEEQINIVSFSAEKTFDLLEEILIWAKSHAGQIPHEPEYIDFMEVCTSVVAILNQSATDKNIEIKLNIARIIVFADVNMLKAILRNLISNAIKFTHKGGEVSINIEQSGHELIIAVSDTGIGITPERQQSLFDITQIRSTIGTANEQGTGLGLLLCKEFVEKHGGKIWVTSEEGRGSDFKFTIPV